MSVALANESGGCLDENTLSELIEGALSPERQAAVQAHVAACPHCLRVVAVAVPSGASGVRSSERALPAGTRVGRYVVGDQVGAGAMGTVYAAHDPDLDRPVALKVMRRQASGDETRVRLLREGKAMARLAHPGVITVYDVGTFEDRLFVAMELVTGGTLRQWLARRPRDWREVLDVFRRAGEGLACAHAAGLVHRDFKPDNVLVGDDGRVRVTDFGLARAVREEPVDAAEADTADDALDAALTRTGTVVGTPAYMAPEQLGAGAVDSRADVFSFCVTLYEALYGERPFAGSTLPALRASIQAESVSPAPRGSRVPGRIRRAVLSGLRADPADRPSSMDALLRALDERSLRTRRLAAWSVAAVTLAATCVAGAVWWQPRRVEPSPATMARLPVVAAPPPAAPVAPAETATASVPNLVPTTPPPAPAPGAATDSRPARPAPSRAREPGPAAASGSSTEPHPIVIE